MPVLHEAIEKIGFGTLVTNTPRGILASHVPMLLGRERGEKGTLIGHVARGNQQWSNTLPDSEALAMFLGPDTYISPLWYESTKETGETVPTWNYIAVHAYGVVKFSDDPAALLNIVTRLTDLYESSLPKKWHISDAPQEYIQSELKSIVGFEMQITRIEGKWKLNQNRSMKDREGVINALSISEDPLSREVAREMRKTINP